MKKTPTSEPNHPEGAWVKIKETGRKGVVVRSYPGLTEVRIPSDNDWPFPSYVKCHPSKLVRCKESDTPKEPDDEPAPF